MIDYKIIYSIGNNQTELNISFENEPGLDDINQKILSELNVLEMPEIIDYIRLN